ncbi:sugar efflux transporter [Marinimicrobium sp. ABcell2]|uniref:sugar efflux transporter n=1 Tax=Marinimicrobium sp. ABcell2 TaxID=3069751 RepID=UPI0027AF57D4|nr:sugar efflux transporter [Marinimicrobium sp. ABcell2]MDQ2077239.1 sugar efflux transporter [Marinimicrobium sp. ABcell2]
MIRDLLRPVPLGIYFLSFAVGAVAALVLPTFSIFLAQELGVRPLLVGLPFAGLALASIVYNQLIGAWSDKLPDRRPLVVGFCFLGTLSCAIFALSRNYWLVSFSAVVLFSLAMVAYSQMLAYSLDYADRRLAEDRVPLFNAIVRAQIAVAWVSGPPAGFLLAAYFGFSTMYWVAGALFTFVGLVSYKLLPRLEQTDQELADQELTGSADERAPTPGKVTPPALTSAGKRSLVLCLIAFSLMWGANNAYLISLPLHMTENLGLSAKWVGWLMGTAAGLEIPIMLLAGYLSTRVRLITMVRLAGVAGLMLYAGVYWLDSLWHLFILQLPNAIFIGVLAGLGVSVVQQLLPGRSGSASALYTNTTHLGNLFSSLMVAVVADFYGYQDVFAVNLVVIVLAMAAFWGVHLRRSPER